MSGSKAGFSLVTHATEPNNSAVTVYVVRSEEPVKVWGLEPEQRIHRQFKGLSVADVSWAARGSYPRTRRVLLLRGDVMYDTPLLSALLNQPGTRLERPTDNGTVRLAVHVPAGQTEQARAWLTGEGLPPDGTTPCAPEHAGDAYRGKLRKREPPYCLQVDRATQRAVERRVYMAAYKGITDAVTKHVWPVPAMWATRGCVRLGVTPNAVTLLSAVLVLAALWAFATSAYGWGLLAAWLMTFLDTVDGKLARVTLSSSKFGNLFDHGIDLVHPPLWYAAWAYGLAESGHALPQPWLDWTVAAIFVGYVLGRLPEGYFTRRFGFELFVWTRFDSGFRQITARRNPCLVLLTLAWIAGRPDLGILATTAWILASAIIHLLRTVQAERANARGQPVASWLKAPV
ncbi:hypothetical protein CKO28_20275 [Rhodovibrio sodomensis]|uniref:CDP-alcohol phosphatidyltransferase family protein n=1 Tax=Rhodovibrio sodomensis TaxID=1088 RepID=A0ABS1DJH6_9PROT|nr:CDP-alcohol phosphatidyltransferase family protein [Rhodovibrio sodomensis]MBK1670364.1 hypothetical protein [Rhodovibrio sodomensis]